MIHTRVLYLRVRDEYVEHTNIMTPWKLGLFVLWNFQWVVFFLTFPWERKQDATGGGMDILRHQLRADNNVFWVCAQLLLTHEGPPA
jgi:hypothetical protein